MADRIYQVAWMNGDDEMIHQCFRLHEDMSVGDMLAWLGLSHEQHQCAVLGRRVGLEEKCPIDQRLDIVRKLHLSPEEARQGRLVL